MNSAAEQTKTSPRWNALNVTEISIKGRSTIMANIVRDFRIDNTQIKIADDYSRKTDSEVKEILTRIAEQAQRQLSVAAIDYST